MGTWTVADSAALCHVGGWDDPTFYTGDWPSIWTDR